jgi:hypothetical protein
MGWGCLLLQLNLLLTAYDDVHKGSNKDDWVGDDDDDDASTAMAKRSIDRMFGYLPNTGQGRCV